MRFKEPITLQIYILTQQQSEAENIGIKHIFDFENDETEYRRFYCVDMIWPLYEDPRASSMNVSGENYIVKMSCSQLEEKIYNHGEKFG